MHFDLSEEQLALRDAARELLARRWSPDDARRAIDAPPASIPEKLWLEVAALGWIGIAAPETEGGSGADVVTAAVLAEEAGRALLPGPFLSAMAAVLAVARAGADGALVAELATGARRATLAFEEPGGGWGPDAVQLRAVPAGDGWSLDGVKVLVPDAQGVDLVLVAARTRDGGVLVVVPTDAPGVSITPMRRLDAQSVAEIRFDGVCVPPDARVGEPDPARSVLTDAYDVWTALLAADLLGTAQRALEMTVDYAKERWQFGRPIGSFQAVSHRLADVLAAVEIARGVVGGACLALDDGAPDAGARVSAAKAWAGDAAVAATEAAVQLHGGIGYTWELDVHLYLRRARANAVTLGDADHHRDRLAAHLERESGW